MAENSDQPTNPSLTDDELQLMSQMPYGANSDGVDLEAFKEAQKEEYLRQEKEDRMMWDVQSSHLTETEAAQNDWDITSLDDQIAIENEAHFLAMSPERQEEVRAELTEHKTQLDRDAAADAQDKWDAMTPDQQQEVELEGHIAEWDAEWQEDQDAIQHAKYLAQQSTDARLDASYAAGIAERQNQEDYLGAFGINIDDNLEMLDYDAISRAEDEGYKAETDRQKAAGEYHEHPPFNPREYDPDNLATWPPSSHIAYEERQIAEFEAEMAREQETGNDPSNDPENDGGPNQGGGPGFDEGISRMEAADSNQAVLAGMNTPQTEAENDGGPMQDEYVPPSNPVLFVDSAGNEYDPEEEEFYENQLSAMPSAAEMLQKEEEREREQLGMTQAQYEEMLSGNGPHLSQAERDEADSAQTEWLAMPPEEQQAVENEARGDGNDLNDQEPSIAGEPTLDDASQPDPGTGESIFSTSKEEADAALDRYLDGLNTDEDSGHSTDVPDQDAPDVRFEGPLTPEEEADKQAYELESPFDDELDAIADPPSEINDDPATNLSAAIADNDVAANGYDEPGSDHDNGMSF